MPGAKVREYATLFQGGRVSSTSRTAFSALVRSRAPRLLQVPGLSLDIVRGLRFRYRIFDEVESVVYGPGSVPHIDFTRLNEHWRPAAELARLILNQESLRDQAGGILSLSFTVDMNKLFERFVEKIVSREARRARLQLISQAPRHLSAGVPMRPDFVLRAGNRDLAVGDAKYKEPGDGRPPNEDLYQLLAYCVSLGLLKGLLIYSGKLEKQYRVEQAGIVLEAIGIDLTGEMRQIEASSEYAARRLVENVGIADAGLESLRTRRT